MAWELGPHTISRGAPVHWWLHWRDYPGIQVFQARPVFAEVGDTPVGLESTLQIGDVRFEWDPVIGDGYSYYLTVTHVRGFSPATYVLRGARVD